MDEYQRWQIKLEKQPVEFVQRRQTDLLAKARMVLARFLGTNANRLVFVTNATTALNIVSHSVDLQSNDEVLTTDIEYGAMDRMWEIICKEKQAKYMRAKVRLPLQDKELFIQNFWKNVNQHTKLIFLSHITSTTALLLPIREILSKAKQQGIITIVEALMLPAIFL